MLAFVRRFLPLVPVLLLLGLAAGSLPVDAAPPRGDGKVQRKELRAPGLKAHLQALQKLASKHGGTRATGTAGERASFAYVARTLKQAGWRVLAQPFSFSYFHERSAPTLRLVGDRRFKPGRDFTTLTYSGSGNVEGPLRPAGNGCSGAELTQVERGDVALVTRGGCLFRVKAEHAEAAGAAALIVADSAAQTGVPTGSLLQLGTRIPALVVGAASAQVLRDVPPQRVHVRVDAIAEARSSRNLLAETPKPSGGRVVMAGAHVDSVPEGPGINGNGSGVAALLEIARALGGKAPGARIRLAFWGAEEPGLFGSTHYIGQLAAPARAEIAAYLNLDVIGSRKPKRAVYSGGDVAIESLLRDLVGPRAVAEDQATARSDHVPFQAAGIPTGGLFTGAGKPWDACYHRACDRVGNVGLGVLVQMARVTGAAVTRLSRQAK